MVVVQRSSGRSGGRLPTVATRFGTCLVVIPEDVRERIGIRPGQRIRAIAVGTRLEIVAVEPIRKLRGACPAYRLELRREARSVP